MRRLRAISRSVWLVVVVVLIFFAYALLPQTIDALGPRADENQDRCTKVDVPGDPDLTCRPKPGAVKVIRLANDGQFIDRCELTDALYELNWDVDKPYGPEACVGAKDLPRLTILYVHGWKHDASPDDEDLIDFTKLVKTLQRRHEGQKQVLGVYLSWNASNGLGFLDHLSFWSKKRVADRISQSAVVTKIISSIGAMRKVDNERLDQFIIIGHSFGARIVFSATSQELVAATSRAHPGAPYGDFRIIPASADAIILLNPAFEASLYTALEGFCRTTEQFLEDQPPLLISVSTENDWPTKKLFPLGQWLGMFRTEMEMTTLGNFENYRTHSLYKADSDQCLGQSPADVTERFAAAGLCLLREPNSGGCPNSPFIVSGTTKDVIDGHNGIWSDQFNDWVAETIAALEKSHERAVTQNAFTSNRSGDALRGSQQ